MEHYVGLQLVALAHMHQVELKLLSLRSAFACGPSRDTCFVACQYVYLFVSRTLFDFIFGEEKCANQSETPL